jgi:diguanylate cyclase (GGDEF)-like protein
LDRKDCSPSDAVLAVSRLLAPAGGSGDLVKDVRAAVVEEAARFFGVPSALLLELAESDRRVRVAASTGAGAPPADLHNIAALPPLEDFVAGRLACANLDEGRAAALTAALAPEAKSGAGQLIAVGADVLLLSGALPCSCFGGDDQLGEVFVNAAAAALDHRRTAVTHEARMTRQLALTRAAKTLNESLDLEPLLGRICEEAMGLLDADNAAVYHGTPATGFVVGGVAGLPPEFVGWPLESGTGLSGQVVERGRPMLTNDYQSVAVLPPDSPFKRVRAALAVPFGWDGELHGVLSVGWERPHTVGTEELAVLETFTELAGVACRNASAHAYLARAAQTDSLTGCLNHAALHEQLGREIERAARGAAEPPSLVLIDLDHFKQVNEEHGHLTGDEVLRRVGSALRSGVRPYDIAARYGGDEFALVVTSADEETAQEIAARAVHRIAAAIAEFVEGDAAGATAGVASWEPGMPASQLVARADCALVHGKQTGGRGSAHPFSEVPQDWEHGRFTRHGEAAPPVPPVPSPPMTFDAAEREQRLRKRSRQLGLANELGARLAGMTDVEGILEATVAELHRAFGYFLCAIVRDRDGRVSAAAVRGDAFLRLGLQDWSQSREEGLIGRCLRTKRPVLVEDVHAQLDYNATGETTDVRSELVVPLWIGEELWGVINVEELEPAAFDEDDVRLVETVADQVGAALRSASLYEQLERAYLGTAKALVAALEAKDAYTAEHARSIVEQAEAVGARLGLDDAALRDLRFAAVFHDIGKIAVPEAILCKPGALTDEERAIMERHTIVGEQILAPVEFLAGVRVLVRHEHERWDGGGYPDGLAGEAIPLGSRIILACDALHAMTSDRPYRAALSLEDALAELRRHAGTQFDPRVIDALLSVLDESSMAGHLDVQPSPG